MEHLEDRRPLAITPVFAAGVLTFTGDGADDTLVITSNNATSSDIDFSGTGIVGTVNQAGVTAIVINLDGGTDSVTLNGSGAADTIALNALAISYGGTPYSLAGVENLTIDGQAGADTISATGVTVTGNLVLRGGAGAGDNLSVNNLTTGDLEAGDAEAADDVELNLGVTTLSGSQQYTSNVSIAGPTTLNATAAGQSIEFDGLVDGANVLAMNSPAIVFDGAVGSGTALLGIAVGAAGIVTVNGGQVTTTGTQTYTGPVRIGNNAIANTVFSGSSIDFASTLDDSDATARDVEINVTGNVRFADEVGATNALRQLVVNGAARINGDTVITTADQIYNGPVTLDSAVNLTTLSSTTGNVRFLNTLDSFQLDEEILTVNGNNVEFNGAIGSAAAGALSSLDVNAVGNVSVAAARIINSADLESTTGQIIDLNAAANNITATSLIATAATGISLDTTIVNLLASNTTAGGIDINEVNDVNVLLVSAPGQTVTLTAGGAILDANGALNNITAATLIAGAATGISLDTTIANLSANNTTAGGIDINELDGLSVNTVSAPGQTVTLTAGGAILDGNGAANNVTATSLVASAVTGISLDTTIANLVANNSTSGGIDINDIDNLNVSTVSATGQTVSLTAGGALTDGNAAATNVTAGSLIAVAVTGIDLDTTIGSLSATNTTSGNIDINETDNLNVLGIAAPAQTVTLTAGGAITDGNGPAANVIATLLVVNAVTGITLGTTVTNLTANNTTSGGIIIGETDDLNVLLVTAAGQTASIAAAGDINVNTVTAGDVILGASDVITDVNGGVVNIIANSLSATATNGISLDTTIANLTAFNAVAGGIDINETDNLNVLTVSAAGQTVTLNAGGAISDGNAAAVNITAASLVATAATGISLDTNITNLLASNSTSGGIDISETNDLNVSTVLALGQTVTLSAGGALLDGNAAVSNVSAVSLVANAVTGINLDTTIADLTATNTTSGGIDISELDNLNVLLASAPGQAVNLQAGGDLNVTTVNAGNATLIAAGAITDANAAALNVSATSLNALANNGITLGTAISNLTATNNTSGDILIGEADGLTVVSAINAAANIQIISANGLVSIANVDAKGHFVGSTADAAAAGDNLVVTGTIEADSFVSLIAGDDITLQAASNVKSINSFVYLKTDAATVDAAGGTLILFGALQGNAALQYPIVAEGDVGDDLFSIQKLPQSPMAILARGGTLDNTFIVFTNAAEQINVFATIVDLVGNPGIEITYVDNEQLDLVTLGGDDKVFVQMPEPIHGVLANIIRTSTGAGDDSLKINGSTLGDVMRVASYTSDGNYRFQVRGDTGETECLQVFGFTGNDIIENSAPIASMLDGGNGQDHITGSDFAVQPATAQEVYDVIFGGGDADTLFGRGGNDFLYADHDYNNAAPVQTIANGDVINGGRGRDIIIALGADTVTRDPGDFEPDVIVGQNVALSINDFLFAQLLPPNANNISTQLQAGLNKKCALPIP